MAESYILLAKTYAGLEDTLASEIEALGGKNIRVLNKGVRFEGGMSMVMEANLRLRSATRVLRFWQEFEAKNDPTFFEGIKEVDWSSRLGMKDSFALDMILTSDYFERANDLTVHATKAIAEQVRRKTGRRANLNDQRPTVRFHIHIHEQDVLIYLDSSCDSLAWRGWRREKRDSSISDALVAGLLLKHNCVDKVQFLDLACGNGQMVGEAAMIAAGIAPGITREDFGFFRWPEFNLEDFKKIKNKAITLEHNMSATVVGWSRSSIELNAATRNLGAAGVLKLVSLEKINALKPKVPKGQGCLFLWQDDVKPAAFAPYLEVIQTDFAGWKGLVCGPEGKWTVSVGSEGESDVIQAEQGRKIAAVPF